MYFDFNENYLQEWYFDILEQVLNKVNLFKCYM